MMWNFASSCITGSLGPTNNCPKQNKRNHVASECSDDEAPSHIGREEGLECPICFESFNIVENVPYVLWCGHTLCKNCILGLHWAVLKFPTLPVQLPLFISCPWCSFLSFRLVYKGSLKFPRKNYFLLWMLESMNGDREKSNSAYCGDRHPPAWSSDSNLDLGSHVNHRILRTEQFIHHSGPSGLNHEGGHLVSYLTFERMHSSIHKSLTFFVQLTAKFPLVVILLLIIFYAIPASVAILMLYILISVLFALPSILILYLAYPSLDWLVREIVA